MIDEYKIQANDDSFMYRRIIKADDSCLFNSIALALKNSLSLSNDLRKIVAEHVLKDQV